jgi:hypothetical protein
VRARRQHRRRVRAGGGRGAIAPAEAIGPGKDLGSLEVGKLGDLDVLDKNPLDDIKNSVALEYVMKNGRLYDANTLDEVWPRTRAAEPTWWAAKQ